MFAYSNYPKNLKYYNVSNNLAVDKIKNETSGKNIKYFVEPKSEIYTFITENNHGSEKVNRINKNVVDKKLKYEDYKNFLFIRSYMRHGMNGIQSKNHNIGLYKINKIYFF